MSDENGGARESCESLQAHLDGERARIEAAIKSVLTRVVKATAEECYTEGETYDEDAAIKTINKVIDRLHAQVERVRCVCINTMTLGDDDVRPQDILDVMDEATKASTSS